MKRLRAACQLAWRIRLWRWWRALQPVLTVGVTLAPLCSLDVLVHPLSWRGVGTDRALNTRSVWCGPVTVEWTTYR
ncbi:MAG: hypothetical protein QN183_13695 [Armatimonadota bacterium]|nr:hypothetical protein [Armatimonadota bacterium]